MSEDLKQKDIIVGHTYRGKNFKKNNISTNDRTVLWIGDNGFVQFDSDVIKTGHHYKTVLMEEFLKWAKEDVTDK